METEEVDDILYSRNAWLDDKMPERGVDRFLEQYRIYLHIINATNDRQHKVNEYFLGINTAIMGILGYLEGKDAINTPGIFLMVPLVGMAICFAWYRIIISYRETNRAKFTVLNELEKKLPAQLFSAERELTKKNKKYKSFSSIELNIPVIFSVLYLTLFISSLPWNVISQLSR